MPDVTIPKDGVLEVIKLALKNSPFETRFQNAIEAYAGSQFGKNLTSEDFKRLYDKAAMRLPALCDMAPKYAGGKHAESCQLIDEHKAECPDCWQLFEQLRDLKRLVWTAVIRYSETGQIQPPATASDDTAPQDGTHVCQRVGCGVVYTPQRRTSRYCSARCRKLHFTAMQERNASQP
jgi:hypothetical protein